MISVIIPAYNVENYIEESIRSVLNQTYKDLECIVVLDKPTDNTEVVVMKIAKEDSRVRVLKNPQNVGAGLSRRNGLQNARGEYTLLLDGDDYLTPSFIEDLYKKAIETGSDIVSGGITIRRADGDNVTTYGECVCEGSDKVAKFWGENIVFMNNKLIHRRLHELVPYCHRRYIEDTPVIIPQLWYANRVAYVDNPGYIYRMIDTSLTHTTDEFQTTIFKGLCWCDLMEFFNANDPSIYEAVNLKGFINTTLEYINSGQYTVEDINRFPSEWAELMMRLFKLISINNISFKEPVIQKNFRNTLPTYSWKPDQNKLIQVNDKYAFYDVYNCARTSICEMANKTHKNSPYFIPLNTPIKNRIAIWRDPVSRFVSFYSNNILNCKDFNWYYGANGLHTNSTIDEVIEFVREELRKPSSLVDPYIREQYNCYDVNQATCIVKLEDLNKYLKSVKLDSVNYMNGDSKIDLTEEQIAKIKGLYYKDYEIINNEKVWRG